MNDKRIKSSEPQIKISKIMNYWNHREYVKMDIQKIKIDLLDTIVLSVNLEE